MTSLLAAAQNTEQYPLSMTSARGGYSALPQDDVQELTRMAPQTSSPPQSVTSGSGTSGTWRRSDVGQLPVSFSSDVELDELTSASTTTTLTTMPLSPPPHLVAGDQSCRLPAETSLAPSTPSPPMFQVGNSSCTASATSRVKRRLE